MLKPKPNQRSITLALSPTRVMQALHGSRLSTATKDDPSKFLKKGDPVVQARLKLKGVTYGVTVTPGELRGNKRAGFIEIGDPESDLTYTGTQVNVARDLVAENKLLLERISRNRLLIRLVNRI